MGRAVKVTATFDNREMKRALANLGPKKMKRVAIRSLKRAGTAGRASMSKAITKDTGLKARKVKDEIKIKVEPAQVSLTVTGARIPLIEFRARGPEPSRGRGRGVSYKLPNSRGRIKTAFIARMPSGHRGVFHRKGPKQNPIRELFGPSLTKVFEKFVPDGAKVAAAALVKNLRSEIAFALTRSKK